MIEFLRALLDPDLVFLRHALLLGVVGSVSLGAVGTFVVARRISYLAAAISHSALGGIGASLYFRVTHGWEWLHPMLGALLAALLAAGLVGWVSLRFRQREDALIGSIWVTGMAIGLIFIAQTPGYVDPMAYFLGDILLLTSSDLWLAGGVGALVMVFFGIAHRQIIAVCFDAEYALTRGIRTDWIYMLLLLLTAFTVVVMVAFVGVVLVVALLTLPPAIAGLGSRSLLRVLLVAILLNAVFVFVGLGLSFSLDLPGGASVVLVAALSYLIAIVCKEIFKLKRGAYSGPALKTKKSAQ